MTFIECAIKVLTLNDNKPMSSDEILIQIYNLRLPLNSSGNTPQRTLNVILNRNSINSTATVVNEPIFRIIDGKPKEYILNVFEKPNTEINLVVGLKVESLIADYKIYDVSLSQIKWYRYLCVHPHAKEYHIVIDMNDDPIRFYKDHLQQILDKGLRTYDEAKIYLADRLEDKAKCLRESIDK